MNYKKGIDKKYIVLLIVAAVLLLLAFIGNSVNHRRAISFVESKAKDAFLITTNTVRKPIIFVNDRITKRREMNDLHSKYLKLKEKDDKYSFQENRLKALEEEIDSLTSLLELSRTLTDYEMVNATVINRDIGYFYNEITIDKGSNHGIVENSAVVNNDGLIGKVTRTTNNSSTIELLSSNNANNRVSVKIDLEEEDVYGVLSGYDSDLSMFEVDGIADIVDIEEGSFVITTGLGGIYPKGIKVGTVGEVQKDNFDFAKIVYTKPSVCFDSIDYVSVLVRK